MTGMSTNRKTAVEFMSAFGKSMSKLLQGQNPFIEEAPEPEPEPEPAPRAPTAEEVETGKRFSISVLAAGSPVERAQLQRDKSMSALEAAKRQAEEAAARLEKAKAAKLQMSSSPGVLAPPAKKSPGGSVKV